MIHTYDSLHPKTQLSAGSTSSDPIHSRMKLRNSRHSSDPISSKLRDLLSLGSKDINEAIHVADAESLYAVLGLLLPLRAKTVIETLARAHQ